MDVISTRGSEEKISALQAVLQGIAKNGGLFVPETFPQLDMDKAREATKIGYAELTAYVLGLYFDLSDEELLKISQEAYASFDVPEVVPLRPLAAHEHVMELTHGPTLAFKDMALQILPRLTEAALVHEKNEKDILILTATSGDTGKAALEGFKDVPRTAICVYYPEHGVSQMQRLQMITQKGDNVTVWGVEGNFDDAQRGVKELFADQEVVQKAADAGYALSSANSINFGRLVPQVAYYVYAYLKLEELGVIQAETPINFCVPTGNFGNILAAFYAKKMGLPVSKLICASNSNNVLTDFFQTGVYNANRNFLKTMSPSMDILVSSNLERLLFEISGRNHEAVRDWMEQLSKNGTYALPEDIARGFGDLIWADWSTEEEAGHAIQEVFVGYGYLMDPHTAVAQSVYRKYRLKSGDTSTHVVTVSTANPYKFPGDVLYALYTKRVSDVFEAARDLHGLTRCPIPPQIDQLQWRPALHGGVVDPPDMRNPVEKFLKHLSGETVEEPPASDHAAEAANEETAAADVSSAMETDSNTVAAVTGADSNAASDVSTEKDAESAPSVAEADTRTSESEEASGTQASHETDSAAAPEAKTVDVPESVSDSAAPAVPSSPHHADAVAPPAVNTHAAKSRSRSKAKCSHSPARGRKK